MKTLLLTALFAVTTLFATATADRQPKKVQRTIAKREVNVAAAGRTMQHAVEKHLFFPNSGSAQLEGQADVFFQVHPDGEVRLLRINASNEALGNFIQSQVSTFKVDPSEFQIGQVFRYRFNFRKEA